MASFTCEKNSHLQSEQYCRDRHSAYKKLIADLAQHLGKEDVKMIAFKCSLSENLGQSSALDVLAHLDRCAKFSPTNIQPLAELLKDSYRNDLVNDYVEGYRLKYGTAKERHSSMPSSGNRHQGLNRRAYTCPSNMKEAAEPNSSRYRVTYPRPVQETEGITPEKNLFSPTVDNPHKNESACNQSSTQPPLPSVKSLVQQMEHSQPPTSMNYAHPKTVHQFSDQMQPWGMQSKLQKLQCGGSNRSKRYSESISTPASVSASSSMHEMNNYHNPGFSEQDSFPCSSVGSANASQDVLLEPTDRTPQYPYTEGGFSNMHIGLREHSTWYPPHATSSQTSLPSEQALDDIPIQISTRASQYPTDNSLSNEFVPSKPTMHGPNTHLSTTPLPNHHRRTSSPAATFHSVQTEVHKKRPTIVSSAVSDSGVEILRCKHCKQPSAGTSTDTIEPWMSVSQDKEQFEQSWLQPRPRVMSVSTGVQTEGEDGSEKTVSLASLSPRTSSLLQRSHDGIVMEGEDGSEKTESPATLSPRTSLYEGSENCNGGQDTGKQVAAKKSRPRSAKLKLPFSRSKPQDILKWHVKRSTLNKAIYDHKKQKSITCKKKLELDAGCGGANPQLVFHLIPYGIEGDAGKSTTLEIEVEVSRKTRMHMHSATKIKLAVSAQEVKAEEKILVNHDNIEQSIDVSRFFVLQFLTHECLKDSHCEQIEIQASAELMPHSEHPYTPTNS